MQETQETWVLSLGQGRTPGEGKWQPTPLFLPGESCGQRSLAGLHGGHKVGHDRARIEGQTDRRRRYQKGSTQFWQVSRNFCHLLCCPMEQKTVLIIDWEVITKDIVSGYFFPLEPRGFFFFNETFICSTDNTRKYSHLCNLEEKQKTWRVAKAVMGNFLPKDVQQQ